MRTMDDTIQYEYTETFKVQMNCLLIGADNDTRKSVSVTLDIESALLD